MKQFPETPPNIPKCGVFVYCLHASTVFNHFFLVFAAIQYITFLFQKIERRRRALEMIGWFPDCKSNMRDVLGKEFTSPEKSDDETGGRLAYPIVWESSRLSKRKQELDEHYRNNILKTDQARRQLSFISDHPMEQTTTRPPKAAPKWTISSRFTF